jgi:hypothetical protein
VRGSTKYGLLACANALGVGSYIHNVPNNLWHAAIAFGMVLVTLKLADKAYDSRGNEVQADKRWGGK